ncbi:MAG: hypothetical protein JWQ84_1577 [Mucilaginibacter sp.]|jgi:uncharacterized protein (DUF2147 family)|nr:hypothetical protein [Mucilaginibacter sp.]MDB5138586.1 hypothetical protein [Mucilaginibacter sp.]
MRANFLFVFFLALLFNVSASNAAVIPPSERVCGKWESEEKSLIIQVYMKDNNYLARVVWFKDTGNKPMSYWKDVRNPDPALRSRKILGMSILSGLIYKPETNLWEDGMVYDSKHGRTWNASAIIDKDGLLRVRGYWHFKFIGRTMTFKRIG